MTRPVFITLLFTHLSVLLIGQNDVYRNSSPTNKTSAFIEQMESLTTEVHDGSTYQNSRISEFNYSSKFEFDIDTKNWDSDSLKYIDVYKLERKYGHDENIDTARSYRYNTDGSIYLYRQYHFNYYPSGLRKNYVTYYYDTINSTFDTSNYISYFYNTSNQLLQEKNYWYVNGVRSLTSTVTNFYDAQQNLTYSLLKNVQSNRIVDSARFYVNVFGQFDSIVNYTRDPFLNPPVFNLGRKREYSYDSNQNPKVGITTAYMADTILYSNKVEHNYDLNVDIADVFTAFGYYTWHFEGAPIYHKPTYNIHSKWDFSAKAFEIDRKETYQYSAYVLSVDENESINKLSIYPSPADDFLRTNLVDSYKVFNLSGMLILRTEQTNKIDVSFLKVGVYVIVNSKGNSQKFIKK